MHHDPGVDCRAVRAEFAVNLTNHGRRIGRLDPRTDPDRTRARRAGQDGLGDEGSEPFEGARDGLGQRIRPRQRLWGCLD